jgi:flagellar motor switch protein FliG
MVVQLILREGGDLPLMQMPHDLQARLTKELGALKIIDRATLNQVADEFTNQLEDVALTQLGSIKAALKSLEGLISPETAAKLREDTTGMP